MNGVESSLIILSCHYNIILYRRAGIFREFVSLMESTGELSGKRYRFKQCLWFGFAFNSLLIAADLVRQWRRRVLQSSGAAWIIIIGAPPHAHRPGVGMADTTLLRVRVYLTTRHDLCPCFWRPLLLRHMSPTSQPQYIDSGQSADQLFKTGEVKK